VEDIDVDLDEGEINVELVDASVAEEVAEAVDEETLEIDG